MNKSEIGHLKFVRFLFVPFICIIVSVLVLGFLGYYDLARFISTVGTGVVLLGNIAYIAYIVLIVSRERRSDYSWFQRLTRLFVSR